MRYKYDDIANKIIRKSKSERSPDMILGMIVAVVGKLLWILLKNEVIDSSDIDFILE